MLDGDGIEKEMSLIIVLEKKLYFKISMHRKRITTLFHHIKIAFQVTLGLHREKIQYSF
jgi:hypothetical protein